MQIEDTVAIVTGASSGIGLATAKLLSQKGAKVALVSRSKVKLEELAKQMSGSITVPADMTNQQEIEMMIGKVMNHFGRIDILVNNAGQGYDAPVEKINIDTFHKIFDLDVVGPLITMQHVIPIMRSQKGGSIINISSGTALMYLPNMSAYSSLKRALVGISLTAREELKRDNINVSVVYPYITATNFEKNTIRNPDENEENDEGDAQIRKADPPEYIAGKIVEGIIHQDAEIFAHDWMKHRGK